MRKAWVSDSMLLRALDSLPDALVLFTANGKVVYASDNVEAVFGWPPDVMIGMNIATIVHVDDLASAIASVAAFDLQGATARSPAMMRFRWADGTWATLDVNGNPVTDEDGTTLYSMFGRRTEEQRILADTIGVLVQDFDLAHVLSLVYEQMTWALGRAVTTVVWEDRAGRRHQIGADLPPMLTGLDDDTDPDPWHLAWKGHAQLGTPADLDEQARQDAEARGFRQFRLHPVADELGKVRVLVTLWDDATGHPLDIWDNRLRFISDLVMLALRFEEHQQRLHHDATHDALTGLANRRAFFDAISPASSPASSPTGAAATSADALPPAATPTAVVYIDLDGFKPVNDDHGHAAGDLLLIEVAARLSACCRPTDVVARLGGDEFAVACPDTTAEEATDIAKRFLAAVAEPVDVGGVTISLHASAGIAVGRPDDTSTLGTSTLAADADRALYAAKHAGGNRVILAHPLGA